MKETYAIHITPKKKGAIYSFERGKFNGDIDAAVKFIKQFCKHNDVSFKSFRDDAGDFLINGVEHEVNVGGATIRQMLRFCGKDPKDFSLSGHKHTFFSKFKNEYVELNLDEESSETSYSDSSPISAYNPANIFRDCCKLL